MEAVSASIPKRACVYLRVSSDQQDTANQRPDVVQLARARGFEIVKVYEEKASAAGHRPIFEQMKVDAHAGRFEVLIVWALDRLGRSMTGNLQTVLDLDRIGVQVLSVREPWLDQAGPVRSLLLAIFSWISEQERLTTKARQAAGIKRARALGVPLGRKPAVIDLARARQLRAAGLSIREAARELNVGAATLHRYLQADDALRRAARVPQSRGDAVSECPIGDSEVA